MFESAGTYRVLVIFRLLIEEALLVVLALTNNTFHCPARGWPI